MTSTDRQVLPGVMAAGGVLDRIVEAKAGRLSYAMQTRPLAQLLDQLAISCARRSFMQALVRRGSINIIAEIKHRSPSRGVIRDHFEPVSIARSYSDYGAAALSVLTEEDFFGGSLEHLISARSVVELPVLRKDFILSEYQVYESAAAGADAILLIVAILDDDLLRRLIGLAADVGVDALVEVHTADEMERATRAGARIIGVNNRDLTTFKVDLEVSMKLADQAPPGAILISESGIATRDDIRGLKSAGFHAFLIGERFMGSRLPGEALGELMIES